MIKIHLINEMVPLEIKADHEIYDEIRENVQHKHFEIWHDDLLINFNHVTYMEYVEEK